MKITDEMVESAEAAVYKRHERGFLVKPLVGAIDMRRALDAALSAIPASAGEVKVHSQVLAAAQEMAPEQLSQPEWLWYENGEGRVSLGRWPRASNQAPYVRADVAISPSAPVTEAVPLAWTHPAQMQRLKDTPHESSSMWGAPNKTINIPLFAHPPQDVRELEAENERLRKVLRSFSDVADFMDSETEGFVMSDKLSLIYKNEDGDEVAHITDFDLCAFYDARAALKEAE